MAIVVDSVNMFPIQEIFAIIPNLAVVIRIAAFFFFLADFNDRTDDGVLDCRHVFFGQIY